MVGGAILLLVELPFTKMDFKMERQHYLTRDKGQSWSYA